MGLGNRTRTFFAELRQRKVFRAASIYLVMMWTASLGAAELFPAFGLPDWSVRLFVIAAFVGFPVVVVGAWIFEITSEGVLLDRAARSRRRNARDSDPDSGSLTTTWAHPQRMMVSWRDAAGQHQQDFDRPFVMGRDDGADLKIDDGRISRLHARVWFERGCWWIEDLASKNGTMLDGRLIAAPTPLGNDARVSLYEGAVPLELRVRDAATTGPAAVLDHPGRVKADDRSRR